MNQRYAEFGPGVEVALITFSDPKYLRAYRKRTGWNHAILVDGNLEVYQQFGYGRGSFWRVYGWRVLRHYRTILRRDGLRAFNRATEDTLQLGGNAVIAPDGATSWIYRGQGPDDRPTFAEIHAEVRKAQATTS
ncbi:MAG: AhpC/TSA family protein [Acidimicrobiales bacterium]